jgi:DNA-directed RNA polymerase sigma subunit (sigma70/sigma32)
VKRLELVEIIRSSDLSVLDLREKVALEFRAGLRDGAQTLEQIGKKFGITRERVRQLEKQAVEKLRRTN